MMSDDLNIDIYSNPHWILSDNKENFEYSLKYKRIWGVKNKWYPQWKSIDKDNVVFIYLTSPIKKVIGVCKVMEKFIQRKPLWPDEISENMVKYPLRFEFSPSFLLEKESWNSDGINISEFIRDNFGQGAFTELLRGGLNYILYKELIEFLYNEVEVKFDFKIPDLHSPIIDLEEIEEVEVPEHESIKNLLKEIGFMNKFLSEDEYRMNGERLDVVWRRVEMGSPTYVFEVQVAGDVYHALGKLKHAYDLWNSNIFLIIANNEDIVRAENLLNGTFHEIKETIVIIHYEKIKELYNRKLSWIEYEKELGIL